MTLSSSLPPASPPLADRPAAVRENFSALGIDGFILPRGDGFLGEYVAPSDERLAWLTGFTGSAGLAVLLKERGCVFSDGRYTTQMEEEILPTLWDRRHISLEPVQDWLEAQSQGQSHGLKIGYDPLLVSPQQLESWQTPGVTFVPVTQNPVDLAWTDQPAPPASPIHPHPLALAGESSVSKRQKIARALRNAGQAAMILADCTSTAWLFNLRGQDVEMMPIAQGYGLVLEDGHALFFADPERLASLSNGPWLEDGLTVLPPEHLETELQKLAGKKVRLDPATTPLWFAEKLKTSGATPVFAPDLCTLPKALKNSTEQAGHKKAQVLDGLAMARFLFWIEQNGANKTETELAAHLNQLRLQAPDCVGLSFETISGVGPNGASPHYRAQAGHDRTLTPNSVYLVDSGGQYPYGTTDITRTVWFGPEAPPEDIKDVFTRVLKGHIALARARFPTGTPGYRLDTLARSALWEAGLDFDHGTGHGIGSYLSVHEGPQSISPAPRPTGLQAGMILSNEPACYIPGRYGIRTENLMLVRESAIEGPRGKFLEFETLSYTPIDQRLITPALLNEEERNWLNSYHAETQRRLAPHLTPEENHWLAQACKPL